MSADRTSHFTALADDVKAFRHYLQAERGLADNTVLAYGRDLDRFAGWVAGGGLAQLPRPQPARPEPLPRASCATRAWRPPSVARHLVALKMFYRFLRLEERTDGQHRRAAQLAGPVGAHPAGAQPART